MRYEQWKQQAYDFNEPFRKEYECLVHVDHILLIDRFYQVWRITLHFLLDFIYN